MKSKRGRFSGITRPRDRTSYNTQFGNTKVTNISQKAEHDFFVKGTLLKVTIISQTSDTVTFNENGPMPLESFNAYFEHRPRECEYCRQNA